MKKTIAIATILGLSVILQNTAEAVPVTYTFHPFDSSGQCYDINDLDHSKFYAWQISNFSLSPDVQVVGATLTFSNIYDWTNESDDRLYMHLLDNSPTGMSLTTIRSKYNVDADTSVTGVKTYDTKLLQGTDNQQGGDNFSGMGTLITPIWSDPVGGLPANNIVFDFAKLGGSVSASGNIIPGNVNILGTLEDYIRNGNNFSFGFDPDCHYYNDKVTFTITVDSAPVPEPATTLLFGTGLAGLAGVARRKKKA